jgi:hypothetical protein
MSYKIARRIALPTLKSAAALVPTAANAAFRGCLIRCSFHLGTRILQAIQRGADAPLPESSFFGLLCQIWPQRVKRAVSRPNSSVSPLPRGE